LPLVRCCDPVLNGKLHLHRLHSPRDRQLTYHEQLPGPHGVMCATLQCKKVTVGHSI
jgi:hypothetical protein